MNNTYRTSNLALAAFLVAGRHLTLSHVDATDSTRVEFVFDDHGGAGRRLEAAFLTGDAQVPAAEFHRQLRALRRLIEEKSRQRATRGYPGHVYGYAPRS